jgi:hypothetical protein
MKFERRQRTRPAPAALKLLTQGADWRTSSGVKTAMQSSNWFGQLRRERGLFLAVGALLLLLNTLQPLAFAESANHGGWTICRGMAVEAGVGGGTEIPADECPICIAGFCATPLTPAKALLASGIAYSPAGLESSPEIVRWDTEGRLERSVRQTAIRAPPVSI